MNTVYTIQELPKCYYGGEYAIFSFDVTNAGVPLALKFGTTADNIVTITDLDKLNGCCIDGEFYPDRNHSYDLFIEFLKSITLKQGVFPMSMRYDIEYAKKHFFVTIPERRN